MVARAVGAPRWALEDAPNPSVLRLHVDAALTRETIVACPPGEAPSPLDRLFEIEAVRSIELHRYRARLNLRPDADRPEATGHATGVLSHAWGPPADLATDAGPRAFQAAVTGPRRVAESPEMAEGHPMLERLFEVEGVAEAIVGDGLVLVRLGRLFRWEDAQGAVWAAVQSWSNDAGGTPGSTSASS
jgi:hypothetical protein